MTIAVKVEGLSKHFLLGQTFERTLTSRVGEILRGRNLFGRPPPREEFWALRDVGFEIAEGEAMGIVGGNGAGKSTLLKILSRITPPTRGRAFVRGRLSSLLEVGTGFHPELTGRENVFLNGAILGMRKTEVERKFDEIVAFSGVEQFIDTPVKRYSSGMYVRLAFAVAAHLEPDVLIIDEVLAVGDADFQKRCLGKMGDVAREGRTVLFVSHNMAAVQKLCDRAVWLRGGQVAMVGQPDEVIGSYLSESGAQSNDGACRPGYLYYAEGEPRKEVRILSVQLLNADDDPVDEAATLERVRFRIGYESSLAYRSFAVEMQINTTEGVCVLRTSTTPVHQKHFSVEPGRYFVECEFPEFPLAAGDYQLAMSLAIPGVEYLSREDARCTLRVAPRDIFLSGQPPTTNRYLVATRHDWTYPWAAP